MKKILTLIFVLVLTGSCSLWAQKKEAKKDAKSSESQVKPSVPSSFFSAITFRSVGPAWASGRIADLAVNPSNHSEIYAAIASGNIWKSVNNDTTWDPILDKQGAYAIGCIVIDLNNNNVVWAGTRENNHQRELCWGDGRYH